MVRCSLNFDSNPSGVFFAGQQVAGSIEWNNEKAREMSGLKLTLEGAAKTHWTETTGTGDDAKSESYGATESYLNTVIYLLGDGISRYCCSSSIDRLKHRISRIHELIPLIPHSHICEAPRYPVRWAIIQSVFHIQQ